MNFYLQLLSDSTPCFMNLTLFLNNSDPEDSKRTIGRQIVPNPWYFFFPNPQCLSFVVE